MQMIGLSLIAPVEPGDVLLITFTIAEVRGELGDQFDLFRVGRGCTEFCWHRVSFPHSPGSETANLAVSVVHHSTAKTRRQDTPEPGPDVKLRAQCVHPMSGNPGGPLHRADDWSVIIIRQTKQSALTKGDATVLIATGKENTI